MKMFYYLECQCCGYEMVRKRLPLVNIRPCLSQIKQKWLTNYEVPITERYNRFLAILGYKTYYLLTCVYLSIPFIDISSFKMSHFTLGQENDEILG